MSKELINLDKFNVQNLPEIKGKKEIQLQIVEENPFVEILDHASYELAKKRRTTLRTARTSLEKEEKIVTGKVRENILEPIKQTYKDLIDITVPAEAKQQEEVTKHEQILEQKRLERERLEQERKDTILSFIKSHFETEKEKINKLEFKDLEEFEIATLNKEKLEEFENMYEGNFESLKILLTEKRKTLEEKESIRLETERLEGIRKENERKDKIRSAIDSFYNRWHNTITTSTYENVKDNFKNFQDESPLDCQEFQPQYADKRASLVSQFESRIEILTIHKEQLIERERMQKEREAIERKELLVQRKQQLFDLGFDADLVYSQNGLNILLTEDDVVCESIEWDTFIEDTKRRIKEAQNPTPVENIEVESEEVKPEQTESNKVDETIEPYIAPAMLESPNIEQLKEQVSYYINELAKPEEERQLKDPKQYIFEAAVEAFYGEQIWNFINKRE